MRIESNASQQPHLPKNETEIEMYTLKSPQFYFLNDSIFSSDSSKVAAEMEVK